MVRIISVANQKGGVGKTTTVVNLSASLAMDGFKVLAVDFDPQANTGSGFGISVSSDESIYSLLLDDSADIFNFIKKTQIDNCFLLPAHSDLSGLQVEITDKSNKYFLLKNRLESILDSFDFIFIDTPPSFGFLTLSSLAAADEVLIPLQAEYYALEGLSQLFHTIKLVQKKLNPDLEVLGIVLTMYDIRTNLSEQVLQELNQVFKDKLFKTIIPRNVRISESPSFGQPVVIYSKDSSGAQSYRELAKEVVERG
jgi:chromosome segregation ATPase